MRRSILLGIVGLLTIFALASLVGSPAIAQPKDDPQNAIEVAPGGPLHEAFAQPFEAKPGPGPMIPKEPPPLIPEEPPEQRPEADNVQWIPGYWAWDAQKQDFMWVSGVYRVPPQDRTFVPGYWEHTTDGWRWVTGFWSGANQQQLPYTPEPPAPLDNGPSMPQPDDNSLYVPGVWVYRDGRFIWRPGYYAPAQLGRVWSPSRYVWTPSGYIFVDGFWDSPFEDRGLIFANVYFRRPLWQDAGWRFRPSLVVGFDPFFDSAFVYGPNFYFGNFYDPFYARLGFNPWYHGRGRYDPLFSYHGWRNHSNNPNWVHGAQQTFAARSAGRAAAPVVATTPLNRVTNVKVVNSTPTQIKTQQTFVQQTRQVAVNRQQADAAFVSKGGNSRTFEGRSLNVSPSEKTVTIEPRSTTVPRITTPSIDTRSNAVPKIEPKATTPVVPRTITPAPKVEPKATTPTPAPRVNPTPPSTAPRVNPTPPPSPPRTISPPPPARKVDAPAPTPKVTSQPKVTPQTTPKVAQPRSTAPRIQSTPSRPQVTPRVNNPPARNTTPARPANTGRKR